MTLGEALDLARSIPRSARVAQGYPRIGDFARRVMSVRQERAGRRIYADSLQTLRREIAGRLERILWERQDLRRAARREAGLDPRDSAPCRVDYAPRDPGEPLCGSRLAPAEQGRGYVKRSWQNGSASGTVYHPSTRRVSVPAAWVLARLREEAKPGEPMTAIVRRLDPRERIRKIPHYIERIAASVLDANPVILTEEERDEIARRAREISRLREERAKRQEIEPFLHRAYKLWRGIRLVAEWEDGDRRVRRWAVAEIARAASAWEETRRAAAAKYMAVRARRFGPYELKRSPLSARVRSAGVWLLSYAGDEWRRVTLAIYMSRPARREIAEAIRYHRTRRMNPWADPMLGWRAWRWDPEAKCLVSPHQETRRESDHLVAERWSGMDAVRGHAGIHARRMPMNWLRAGWPEWDGDSAPPASEISVTGVVEIAPGARYVLGETGWRAQSVIIRELCAPSVEIMLELIKRYPGVRVHLAPGVASTSKRELSHEDRGSY